MFKVIILAALLMSCATLFAQPTFQTETIWLFKPGADQEEDYSPSSFPNVKTPNPIVAQRINKAIQMEELGFVLDDKRLAELVKDKEMQKSFFSFSTGQIGRLLVVTVSSFHRNNTMSNNGWSSFNGYYFDLVSGDRVNLKTVCTADGFRRLENMVVARLRTDMTEKTKITADRMGPVGQDDMATTDECLETIRDSFCLETVSMTVTNQRVLNFLVNDCEYWPMPRPRDTYNASVTWEELMPFLTQYGKYLFNSKEPVVKNEAVYYRLWKGKIGTKIPVTLMIKPACAADSVRGLEVYDQYGSCIAMAGSYKDNALTFNEMLDKKIVGTITATLAQGKLTGTWKKTDGSKVLPFEAVVSGD